MTGWRVDLVMAASAIVRSVDAQTELADQRCRIGLARLPEILRDERIQSKRGKVKRLRQAGWRGAGDWERRGWRVRSRG